MLSLMFTIALASTPHADFEADVLSGRTAVPHVRIPVTAPPVTPGPVVKVYGYQAYWSQDLNAVPWDDLSHIAIFSAGSDSYGNLSYTSRWDSAADAVAAAAPYGVHVHLCVTNFNTTSLENFLGSPSARQNLIDQLVAYQASTGAHGVNIDFEGLPSSRRNEMVQFVTDLEAAVGEVALATPSVDWSNAWDYAALSQHADLFIMGYGYHWGGSSEAGPNDPLYAGSGTVWTSPWSLSWTVDDYLAKGADPERVILGLPLYGNAYPTSNNNVPTTNNGSGSSIFMAEAIAIAATEGAFYEETSWSPYTYDGVDQIWYPSTSSVLDRIDYTLTAGIGGFGFWALHYDDDDAVLWGGIHDRTADTSTPGTGTGTGTGGTIAPGAVVADAGLPFMAYIGDTVILSGEGSRGPDGVALAYDWSQVAGPSVTLDGATTANPSFEVTEGGTHEFQLIVSAGGTESLPAYSHVVVVDLDDSPGCACDTGTRPFTAWLALPLLLLLRRADR